MHMLIVNYMPRGKEIFIELIQKKIDFSSISAKLHHCFPAEVTSSAYNESTKWWKCQAQSHTTVKCQYQSSGPDLFEHKAALSSSSHCPLQAVGGVTVKWRVK